jgi:hypothetical protein
MYLQGILIEAGYRRTVSRRGELWVKGTEACLIKPRGTVCFLRGDLEPVWVSRDDERGARALAGLPIEP